MVHGNNLVVIQQKQSFFLLVKTRVIRHKELKVALFNFIQVTSGERWGSRYNKITIPFHQPNKME